MGKGWRPLLAFPVLWFGLSLVIVMLTLGLVIAATPSCRLPGIIAPIAIIGPLLSSFLYAQRQYMTGIVDLTDLMTVVCLWILFGLIATMAYSNMFGALDRGRQHQAMAQMRLIADCIDSTQYQRGATAKNITELNSILKIDLSDRDPWCGRLVVRWNGAHYLIRSYGRDERRDSSDDEVYVRAETQTFEADIVLEDGEFTRYPQGLLQ